MQGMRPLIGYNYGAGESKRVREIFRSALVLIAGVMVIGDDTIWKRGASSDQHWIYCVIGLRHGIRCVGRTGKGKRIVGNFCAQVHSSYFTIGIYFE